MKKLVRKLKTRDFADDDNSPYPPLTIRVPLIRKIRKWTMRFRAGGGLYTMMEIMLVMSSAPEFVGLLSELNGALEQLENSVNPLLVKVQNVPVKKEGSQYLEVKKQLMLSYCQAITFYLFLKSEGSRFVII